MNMSNQQKELEAMRIQRNSGNSPFFIESNKLSNSCQIISSVGFHTIPSHKGIKSIMNMFFVYLSNKKDTPMSSGKELNPYWAVVPSGPSTYSTIAIS